MSTQRHNRIAIVGGKRTPFAKAGTLLKDYTALDLAIHATRGLVEFEQLDQTLIDDVVFGVVAANPRLPHLAREIVLQGDLDPKTRALTLSDNCISGATALRTVYDSIAMGRSEVGIAGGAESMSNPPLVIETATARILQEAAQLEESNARNRLLTRLAREPLPHLGLGLAEPSTGLTMGEHTELMVKDWNISRQDQDELALRSHQNAHAATEDGRLTAEIHPLNGISQDQQIRPDTSLEKLGALDPVFDRTEAGTITAGNASPLTDGAAALLLMSETRVKNEDREPLAFIKDMEFAAIDPKEGLLMAPAIAVPKLLSRNRLNWSDIDIVEMHEAFAGQVLANIKAWVTGWKAEPTGRFDMEKLNPLGSSIAVGHPLAATGARIILTLANELNRRGSRYGLVSICAAGGLGAAVLLERDHV